MSVYTDKGYDSRADYLKCLAEDNGVPLRVVKLQADLLGPNEDFDGLVNSVEDITEDYDDLYDVEFYDDE